MILKTLTLRNFRKFKNTTIEFPDGVTGVIGLNGVGKSTIFEAIAWTLYGPIAARTQAEQIKTQGTPTNEPCRAELEFTFEDENYRVVREMKGKHHTPSATVTINGKIAATSAETVTRYMQKKLGMDFKSFYTSIFAKQKELNTLSSMNASERRPLILRMLGIDSLDDIIKEIRSDKKNKDNLVEKLNQDLVDENGKNKDQIFKQEIKSLETNKKETETILKKSREQIKKLNIELKTLEKNNQMKKKNYERLNTQKEKQTEQKNLFEQKQKLQTEIREFKQKIQKRNQSLLKEKKKLESFKNLENDIKKTEKRHDDIKKTVENFVKTIEQKKTLIQRLKKDIAEIDSKKSRIEKLGPEAECPTCERELKDQYNVLIKKFEKEKKTLEKELYSYQKELKTTDEEKERVHREQNALNKKTIFLQSQYREMERVDTIIRHIASEVKSEKIELEKREIQLKKIGMVKFDEKDFEKLKKQVETVYEDYQKSVDVFNKRKDEFSVLNLDFEKKQGDIRLVDMEIKNLQEKVKELEHFKNQIKEEKSSVRFLGMLSDVMGDFRTFLISRIRPTLSSYSSDFFSRLTDGKYFEVELDENYDLLVYDRGESFGIERFSGGEEDLANLCLRLAISEVITERAGGVFNFIVLDEIFGSQDMNRRKNIMMALNGLSSKFRQIFLITHVDELKNDMENVIIVRENEDGCSSVKIE
jgi:exonuclease SbcC